MINHYLFWTQNETPTAKDTYIVDNEILTEDRISEYRQEMREMLDWPIRHIIGSRKSGDITGSENLSPNFLVDVRKEGIFYQGSFQEKDFRGRRMAFVFVSKSRDPEAFWKGLEECGKILGGKRSFIGEDRTKVDEMIKKMEDKKKLRRNRVVVPAAVVVFLIVVTVVLISRCSNN